MILLLAENLEIPAAAENYASPVLIVSGFDRQESSNPPFALARRLA